MPGKNKRFVLSDQSVANSYGFFIMTEGIRQDRFRANPVMLSDHLNSNCNVIGRWINIEVKDGQLTAEAEFDTVDKQANKIGGKVERDFIKGASMGILFDPSDLVYIDDQIILQSCEITEASIVPVPSNKNAIRLYNKEGELWKEDEIKQLCLSLSGTTDPITQNLNPKNNEEHTDMKKITLSIPALMALGITNPDKDGIDASVLEGKILGLANSVASLTAANKTLTDSIEAEQVQKATDMVEQALAAGKITADKKEEFLEFAKANFSLAKSTLEAIPAKTSLSAQVNTPAGTGEVKTMEEFQKLSLQQQLSFKNDNPEGYAKLLTYKK
ncbi:caudovirus prohead protease [Aquimarina algiphila]|uniref:caudovirus prohead protease n=1 Tax=Aquimarina algiphila TaxID=2047982 RepID=UPI00232B8DA3|nr:caudovirus prohead protease [Aquimarina algiphila]